MVRSSIWVWTCPPLLPRDHAGADSGVSSSLGVRPGFLFAWPGLLNLDRGLVFKIPCAGIGPDWGEVASEEPFFSVHPKDVTAPLGVFGCLRILSAWRAGSSGPIGPMYGWHPNVFPNAPCVVRPPRNLEFAGLTPNRFSSVV